MKIAVATSEPGFTWKWPLNLYVCLCVCACVAYVELFVVESVEN